LHLNGNDDLEIFVNGAYVSNDKTNAVVSLAAGTNSIAIFVSHHGRNKAYNYLGSLDDFDRKGLWGKTTLRLEGNEKGITGWAMRGGVEADLASVKDWKRFADTKKTPAFYRATFETTPPKSVGPHPILRINYEGLSRGTMWINGHNLGRYPEKLNIHSLYIPECWLRKGKNVLTVFDETGASPKQIKLLVDVASREVIRTSPVANAETPMAIP
jgi:beta-galactosidase